jgi:hypothetical protein
MTMRLSATILLVIASAFCPVECFQTALPAAKPSRALLSTLSMAPKFDPKTQKWSPTSPEDEEGYPVCKEYSLVLQNDCNASNEYVHWLIVIFSIV